MSDFKVFAVALARQFQYMSQHELFRTACEGQDIWDRYLDSFPEGTNEIYRKRRYYDGSYDRNVIRRIGNVVAIIDGQVTTIWDIPGLPHPFDTVVAQLADRVRSSEITGLFRIKEQKLGYVSTTERLDDGQVITWNHFHVDIGSRHRTSDVDTVLGNYRTTAEMFVRAANELKKEAIDDVLDLIREGNLYRGEEHKAALNGFRALACGYHNAERKDVFLWSTAVASPFARFKNTVIGTLVSDLSEGIELEKAVKSFETKVAPANYKRPTALITQGMVKAAMQTINDLGLEDALARRFAVMSDVSVNNVLWVNREAASKMKGGIESLLDSAVTKPKAATDKAEDISIADFMAKVLPKAGSMEVLFTGNQQRNLMSLTAPIHRDVAQLFKWNNNFAWSYNGNITDSIKEKVKAAGGNIDAKLRVSLAWNNKDDLDLHSQGPDGHIYFGWKNRILDVDMNAPGTNLVDNPVENQSWTAPKNGEYTIIVDQYSQRSTDNIGYTVQIECDGVLHQLTWTKAARRNQRVCSFRMFNGKLSNLEVHSKDFQLQGVSQNVWSIDTEKFIPVDALMLSPNYWDDNQIGNKHWFFILKDCKNPEATRGIYNEFLRSNLEQHRKVFEVLGNKTKCEPTDDQLSGLGFSSTRGDSVIVRVTGSKINQLYKINFN